MADDLEFVRNALEDFPNKADMENEIVYETLLGDDQIGIALADIEESDLHYHEETTEFYLWVSGNAVAHVDGKRIHSMNILRLKSRPAANIMLRAMIMRCGLFRCQHGVRKTIT